MFDRGLTDAVGLRPADPALAGAGERAALAFGEVEAAARLSLPRAGRRPGRLPAAARQAAPCSRVGLSLYQRRRPDRAARPAADYRQRAPPRASRRAGHRQPGAADGAFLRRRDQQQDRVEQELGELGGVVRTAICRSSRATAGSACSCRRWSASRTISNWWPPPRRPRKAGPAGPYRRLCAAAGSADERDPRGARSGRDRGEHSSGRQLGRVRASPPTVYEEARQSRLGADKFMIDGRHTGTGGGNHVVVGGATPLDSPFLRRPDLLKSADPALAAATRASPICSPACSSARPARRRASTRRGTTRSTSSRSRCRRSRRPATGDAPAPWLVDRLLRNLLIDVTGNTHRAEICIDKLYSPDGPTGRLGLVEFRGFEMPPTRG